MKNVKNMTVDELNEYGIELMLDIAYQTRELIRLQESIKEMSHSSELVDAEIERKEVVVGHVGNQ